VGALLEQGLGHGRRGVGAARRHHAEARGPQDRPGPVVAEDALHLLLGHEGLHGAGQAEAEDEGPQRVPEHEEALAQAVAHLPRADHGHEMRHAQARTRRAMAAEASATFSFAPAPPPAMASATQWPRWSSSSSSATACSARLTAEIWLRTSMQ